MTPESPDRWNSGDAYEAYMGRWSRLVARAFLEWIRPSPQVQWLDVGCGTGALTSVICELCMPTSVIACDPSPSFVEHARATVPDTAHDADAANHLCCHQVFTCAPTRVLNTPAHKFSEVSRFVLPLATLFIPDSPDRPPRG